MKMLAEKIKAAFGRHPITAMEQLEVVEHPNFWMYQSTKTHRKQAV
ncbi:hypothetical protein [Stutzerimonas xanthomarina]|uniref:Uncharacterized protein n=2 Tax=Stutzerimonas xanthomarina TaxID=271420 RepID=A0A1M5N107_9GAMM|nr:hypothetical protein [Stutzerimonas xanthomarina]MCP9337787.1 hypothetical protein [Stutzerimonas xanthomarina]SEH84126.1 hypothetical protein SAMN05216535_2211 [Stutzerimonas xanthomarina]SHG83228.1 hypothetical protein SAMN02744645_1605 [Stutzerimonas xanthomarina DSM 18231]